VTGVTSCLHFEAYVERNTLHEQRPPANDASDDAFLSLPIEPLTDPSPASPLTGRDYESAILASDSVYPRPPTSTSALWTVGTLTYTTGGLVVLFLLLLGGDFAYSIRERSIGPVVQLMLTRLHASDTLLAFLFTTLPTSLSLVISPAVSYRSDRFRSRWGRRIPFLLIPTPVAAAAIIGIAYTDDFGRGLQHLLRWPDSSQQHCALICFAILWTIFEVAAIVAGSVLGGLINDVVPRAVMGRFYGMFRQVSLGAGIIVNYWVIGQAETHYRAIFIGTGVLFFAGFMLMCLTVREGEYPPPVHAGATAMHTWDATKQYFRECFQLSYYRWLFVGLTLAGATFVPVNLFALLFSQQLKVSTQTYGHILAYSYIVSFLMASPLGWLVDRVHALRATIAMVALYAISMISLWPMIHSALTFEIALTLHTVIAGLFFTASAPLGQSLFPRLAFAQYSSAAGIVASLFTIAFGPALGQLMDRTDHNYRLTFLVAGTLGLAAVTTLALVHRDFKRLGGPAAYTPPA
jgi:MFS family permease